MRSTLSFVVILILVLAVVIPVTAQEKPEMKLDWYGYVKLDAAYDQNATSHGNFVMWVQPQADDDDDAQFNMTHKQTRFGLSAKGSGYRNATVGGNVEVDLYGGGGAENKAELLLRHAYFTVQTGRLELLAGQCWDLISPLNPSTLNYPVLWSSGNIGYRRPQLRLSYRLEPDKQTQVVLAGGFFRTIGDDLTPTFSLATEVSDGSDDGTDAAVPTFQGLLDVQHTLVGGAKLQAGLSGLYGELKAEGSLGTAEKYLSRAIVGHFALSFASGFGFSGEYFSGSNLGGYYGGIANSSTLEGVDTKGGWAYGWFKPHALVKVGAGAGMDDPDDATLASTQRSKNTSYFGNVNVTPIPLFTVGLEVSQWKTGYIDGTDASAFRAQTSFVLNF